MEEPPDGTKSLLDTWEVLAEPYAARVDHKAHNADYDRPATLSLLPDVAGLHVLDAGCGPGVYSEWLVNHGAEVVAVDASSKMVQLAKERLGGRVDVRLADLRHPLDFLEDASFDLVLSPLVLDHIRDWQPVFQEFYRVLREGGLFVFSIGHPYDDFHRLGGDNYFSTELISQVWRGFGTPVRVKSYRRPMGEVISRLIEASFILERILEPQPTAAFKEKEPEDYERLMKGPGFMCVRTRKAKGER